MDSWGYVVLVKLLNARHWFYLKFSQRAPDMTKSINNSLSPPQHGPKDVPAERKQGRSGNAFL